MQFHCVFPSCYEPSQVLDLFNLVCYYNQYFPFIFPLYPQFFSLLHPWSLLPTYNIPFSVFIAFVWPLCPPPLLSPSHSLSFALSLLVCYKVLFVTQVFGGLSPQVSSAPQSRSLTSKETSQGKVSFRSILPFIVTSPLFCFVIFCSHTSQFGLV